MYYVPGTPELPRNSRNSPHYAELRFCRRLFDGIAGLESMLPGMTPSYRQTVGNTDVFVLKKADAQPGQSKALVWLVAKTHTTPDQSVNLATLVWTGQSTVHWINPWRLTDNSLTTIANESHDLTNPILTKFSSVNHSRPLAGKGDGSGPHEQEDVLLWIIK